jgi:predicted SAM-dependent methyltransferase
MAFKKSLFNEIGDFDEAMWPCCGEEIDFCLRVRGAGYRIGIAQDVYVHHQGSVTFGAMKDAGQVNYLDICKRNDNYLAEKWGRDALDQRRAIISSTATQDGAGEAIRINLGCGYAKITGHVNIDNRADVEPDLICNVIDGLPYENNSVDEVRAFDFLEHIPIGKTIKVITEIWRVLKPGGKFESFTPSTDGRGAFQDPFHVSFWNQNSWLYYSDPETRRIYGIEADFQIESIGDTLPDLKYNIIHTHVIAKARKATTPDEN